MSPTVSIIIPVYNAELEISKTITSVLNQTYLDYEIIVVNDGSTDGSLVQLEKFSGKIQVLDQENGGVSKARNSGIKAAKGKYIAFLDSDDLWHPLKLSIQVALMEKNHDWLASYTVTSFDKDYEFIDFFDYSYTPSCTKRVEDIFRNPYLVTSSFVIINSFCKSIGSFNENLGTAEDIDLYLRTSVEGNIGFIDLALTWKADTPGSLGSLLSSYEDNLLVIDEFLDKNKQLGLTLTNDVKKVKASIYQNWGKDLLWDNQPKKAIFILIQSLCYNLSISNFILITKGLMKLMLLPFKR